VQQRRRQRYERYEFQDSPWVQNLTQRDLAVLIGRTKTQLEALVRDKDKWVLRKAADINGKKRSLAVPVGKLRTVHERLKYHLNKIKQPAYLFSPRKGRSQRDNAKHHLAQNQFLSIDIRQFYPSTTTEHVFRWAHHVAGMRSEVAGLFTHLVTIDGKMPFGSPISPILTTHVHRAMFDRIYAVCLARDLHISLWVDDLTISGHAVPGEVVGEIREIIRISGLQSHKIRFRSGGRPVTITGVPIESGLVGAPRSLHERIKNAYSELRYSHTDAERCDVIERLLSHLGTYRYHVGAATPGGRKAADRMNHLRRSRTKLSFSVTRGPDPSAMAALAASSDPNDNSPF
jgi:RNA-directed DNA polymerase